MSKKIYLFEYSNIIITFSCCSQIFKKILRRNSFWDCSINSNPKRFSKNINSNCILLE